MQGKSLLFRAEKCSTTAMQQYFSCHVGYKSLHGIHLENEQDLLMKNLRRRLSKLMILK